VTSLEEIDEDNLRTWIDSARHVDGWR
jgi:hypothetical protein